MVHTHSRADQRELRQGAGAESCDKALEDVISSSGGQKKVIAKRTKMQSGAAQTPAASESPCQWRAQRGGGRPDAAAPMGSRGRATETPQLLVTPAP